MDVSEEMVTAFKAEWEKANEEGDTGNRVRRGLAAALNVQVSEPRPYVASNGNRFTADQARLITEPLRYDPEGTTGASGTSSA